MLDKCTNCKYIFEKEELDRCICSVESSEKEKEFSKVYKNYLKDKDFFNKLNEDEQNNILFLASCAFNDVVATGFIRDPITGMKGIYRYIGNFKHVEEKGHD